MRPTNKKLLIIILLMLFCFALLFAGCSKSREPDISTGHEVSMEDLIAERSGAKEHITRLQNQYHEYELKLEEIHKQAYELREYVNDLNFAIYGNEETIPVMNQICELSPSSPMCNDWEMMMDLKDVADKRGVDYKLLLGIMYAESHIGANFKPYNCSITNNWGGLKARKYDDGTLSEKFDKQYESLNDENLNGCWLYKFDSVHQFFESLANTISIGYAKCNEDVYCIMKSYVGHESGAWVRNVYLFKAL